MADESLAVITARLDAFERLMAECDRLYSERHEANKDAVSAALVAVQAQTTASFLASEKAIGKAEEAQRAYNLAHNDLSRKMESQYSMMMPRTEAMALYQAHGEKFDEIKREIVTLREFASTMGGKSSGSSAMWGYVIAAAMFLVALAALFIRLGGTP